MPRAISKATWDQIKIARAAGASYGELAERTGISKGTILAHAHRHGRTRDIALARPKGDTPPPNVADAIVAILHERGQQTRMHLSEFLVKAAKRLAERGEDVSIDSIEAVKAFEQIRASLFPSPTMIDRRSVSVNVSGGLSEEALQRIEAMTKLM
jgi:transposase